MDELLARLIEVGRVVSAANVTKLNAAVKALQDVLAINNGGTQEAERAVAEAEELLEAAKTEGGIAYPPEAYAYVPDPKMPFGWKLRLWANLTDKETAAQVGAAVAALSPGGFRGKQVVIPAGDLPKVKARVKAAWIKVNPDKGVKDMPAHLAEAGFMSYNDIRQRLSSEIKSRFGLADGNDSPWIEDVYDAYLVYSFGGKMYQLNYTADDKGKVTLDGEPFEVMRVTHYEPVGAPVVPAAPAVEAEAALLRGDIIPLEEKAVAQDGTLEAKVIQPGWGSSGYYSKEMLARDAGVYKSGTKMYWDHPTLTEDKERPERSLRDLTGELTSTGVYKEKGPRGPGVYAQAKVFAPYRAVVEELAPHIGLSHRAYGKAMTGEAEGKKGPIIEKLVAASSVDFVTTPGAGGQVVQIFEAARGQANGKDIPPADNDDTGDHSHEEANRMDETKLQELEEAKTKLEEAKTKLEDEKGTLEQENARLKEAAIIREARDVAAEKVGASDLPEITRARLIETLAAKPVLKEGALDNEEYGKAIDEAIKAEAEYVEKITGAGQIKGMGSTGDASGKATLKETAKSKYVREGKSEDEAERMAEIFVNAR